MKTNSQPAKQLKSLIKNKFRMKPTVPPQRYLTVRREGSKLNPKQRQKIQKDFSVVREMQNSTKTMS